MVDLGPGAVWVDGEGVGVGSDGDCFGGCLVGEHVDDAGGGVVLFVHVSVLCGVVVAVNRVVKTFGGLLALESSLD